MYVVRAMFAFTILLECAAARCGAWLSLAVCCSVLQGAALWCGGVQYFAVCCTVLQCVAVRVAVCCSVLQCAAVCCRVL